MVEAMKRDKQGPVVDIISLVMISSNTIQNSTQTKYVKAKLTGAQMQAFDLDGDRQTIMGNTVKVRIHEETPSYRLPYAGKDRNESLQPTALIQSDDKRIKDQAVKIFQEKKMQEAAKVE
jgi:hypothetical protein